jgi:hypothetical protein
MNAQTFALAMQAKRALEAPRTAQEQREDALIVQASKDAPYLAPGVARRLLYGMHVK